MGNCESLTAVISPEGGPCKTAAKFAVTYRLRQSRFRRKARNRLLPNHHRRLALRPRQYRRFPLHCRSSTAVSRYRRNITAVLCHRQNNTNGFRYRRKNTDVCRKCQQDSGVTHSVRLSMRVRDLISSCLFFLYLFSCFFCPFPFSDRLVRHSFGLPFEERCFFVVDGRHVGHESLLIDKHTHLPIARHLRGSAEH